MHFSKNDDYFKQFFFGRDEKEKDYDIREASAETIRLSSNVRLVVNKKTEKDILIGTTGFRKFYDKYTLI